MKERLASNVRRLAAVGAAGFLVFALVWVALALPGQAQSAQAQPAPTVADVPPDHWAYRAVMTLVQRGYLSLEAGRFDGSRPVDRYTLAAVVARLLQDVEAGQVRLTGDDLRLVRQLTGEFRQELARWQDQRVQLSQRLDDQARNVGRIDAKLSDVLSEFSNQARATDEALKGLRTVTSDLGSQVASLSQELAQLKQDLGQGRVSAEGMRQALVTLESGTGKLEERINGLNQQLNTLAQQMQSAASSKDVENLNGKLASLSRDIEAVRGSLAQLVNSLTQSGIQPEQAGALIAAQQENLRRLQGSLERLDQLAAAVQALQQQDAARQKQLAALQAQLEEYRQQAQAAQQAQARLQKEVDDLRANVGTMRQAMGSLVREASPAQGVPAGLAQEVEQLRNQNRWLMGAALAGVVLGIAALIIQ
ncbi:MAG: hypothetical protein IMX02_03935 [Limnochordaceae bacterium]|nr:hypothetical protein [Limnochordaceae bacterium]